MQRGTLSTWHSKKIKNRAQKPHLHLFFFFPSLFPLSLPFFLFKLFLLLSFFLFKLSSSLAEFATANYISPGASPWRIPSCARPYPFTGRSRKLKELFTSRAPSSVQFLTLQCCTCCFWAKRCLLLLAEWAMQRGAGFGSCPGWVGMGKGGGGRGAGGMMGAAQMAWPLALLTAYKETVTDGYCVRLTLWVWQLSMDAVWDWRCDSYRWMLCETDTDSYRWMLWETDSDTVRVIDRCCVRMTLGQLLMDAVWDWHWQLSMHAVWDWHCDSYQWRLWETDTVTVISGDCVRLTLTVIDGCCERLTLTVTSGYCERLTGISGYCERLTL